MTARQLPVRIGRVVIAPTATQNHISRGFFIGAFYANSLLLPILNARVLGEA